MVEQRFCKAKVLGSSPRRLNELFTLLYVIVSEMKLKLKKIKMKN